jgi:DNA-directed RNA polymerase specialized sigma24 family protein
MSERAQQHRPVQGDEAALYERHAERLQRSVAHALGGDSHHAEDACAFAWAQLVAIQPERTERIFAWLRTTAIRKGITLAVRDRREAAPTIAEDADEGGSWEERLVDAEILERSLEGREAAETLKALRPREARYLALLAAGYSYAEIAEREGVTNVNKHLTRGALRARELREGGENRGGGA